MNSPLLAGVSHTSMNNKQNKKQVAATKVAPKSSQSKATAKPASSKPKPVGPRVLGLQTKRADPLIEHVFGRTLSTRSQTTLGRAEREIVIPRVEANELDLLWRKNDKSGALDVLATIFRYFGVPVDPQHLRMAYEAYAYDRDSGYAVSTAVRDAVVTGIHGLRQWISPDEQKVVERLEPSELPARPVLSTADAAEIVKFANDAAKTDGGAELYQYRGNGTPGSTKDPAARIVVEPTRPGQIRTVSVSAGGRSLVLPLDSISAAKLTAGFPPPVVEAGAAAGFVGGQTIKMGSDARLLAAPAAMGSMISSNSAVSSAVRDTPYGPGTVLRGREIFATLQSSSGFAGRLGVVAPGGQLITNDAGAEHYIQVSPMAFGGRARDFAHLFNRSHIHKLRVKYVPSCGTTTSQSVAIAVFDDAQYARLLTEGTTGTGTGRVPESNLYGFVMANHDARMSSVWSPFEVEWNMKGGMADQENWLYNYSVSPSTNTSADTRQHSAGNIVVVLDEVVVTGSTYGHILLEYEIIYADPSPNLSAYLPSQIGALAGPISDELGDKIKANPEPFFALLAKYGIGMKPPLDDEEQHILRILRDRGLLPPQSEETPYQQWLDKGTIKFSAS